MAQTKKASARRSGSPKSSSAKSTGSSRARSAKSSKSSNGSSRARSASQSSKAKAQTKKTTTHASSNGAGTPSAVKEAVKTGAEGAAEVVRKAKVPLVASSAAVAGVAGAVVLSRTGGKRRKVLGVSVPRRSKVSLPKMPNGNGLRGDARKIAGAVSDAAKRADHFGQRVSSVANSVQKVSETASDAAKKA